MTSPKLSPRQKMINMMYLVLIALLALNVSREILKSFFLFELSFQEANQKIESKNSETMKSFNALMMNEKTKKRAEHWVLLADKARKISADFNAYVEKMKQEVIARGGGREIAQDGNKALTELNKPDDMEEHAYYFMDEGLGHGKKLQKKINETRDQLTALVLSARNGDKIRNSLLQSTQLQAKDPETKSINSKTWVSAYLENSPLAGVITLLAKTQNDCKALEADVLNVLSENINIDRLSTDGQMAVIFAESQTVMSGEFFQAKVALATYDSKTDTRMYVNGKPIDVKNGFGEIKIQAQGTSENQLQAEIESIDPKTGLPILVKSLPLVWNSYQASATISADNMNVLFIGLDNPLSISIPGITPANTIVTSNNGINISKGLNGKYIARVAGSASSGGVLVSARLADGSIKKMGEMIYRIRKVPKPRLAFGSLNAGTHEKSKVKVQQYFYAVLDDFYFANVLFKVSKFKASLLSTRNKGDYTKYISGNSLSELSGIINSAASGDVLYLSEIEVKGPSGTERPDPFIIQFK